MQFPAERDPTDPQGHEELIMGILLSVESRFHGCRPTAILQTDSSVFRFLFLPRHLISYVAHAIDS
jgi:hypothetical protein